MPKAVAKRRRLGAEERRELLLREAEEMFAEAGYVAVGLAQIADRANVSKTLLYHYFPNGRPELYREVISRLGSDLISSVKSAMRAPKSSAKRIAGAVSAFFSFFESNRSAYRLLFLEPWGTGEAEIVGQAISIRVQFVSELARALAGSGAPLDTTMAAAAATVGSLLHMAEVWLSDEMDHSIAVQVATQFVLGGLAGAGLNELDRH